MPYLESFFASNNALSEPLPDLSLPQVANIDLSYNFLTHPLPSWAQLKGLIRLILSPNPNLTGQLPEGIDNCMGISELDMLNTSMQTTRSLLLPKTLQPNGQFQLKSIQDNYQCPVITNPLIPRSNFLIDPYYYAYINCRCLPGTYGLQNLCLECPEECDCDDGLSIQGCHPIPNSFNLSSIVLCPNPSSCSISLPNNIIYDLRNISQDIRPCIDGYEDHLCSKCEANYGAQGRSCKKCNDSSTNITLVVVSLVFLSFIVYLYKSDEQASGKLGILVFHAQSLSVVASTISGSSTFSTMINFTFSIGSIQLPNVSCIMDTTSAFGPMIFKFGKLPVLFFCGAIAYKATAGHQRDKVVYVSLNLLRFFYNGIALDVFGAFSCTIFEDNLGIWFLNVWPWIKCDPAAGEFRQMLSAAIPVLIFFVFGLPALFWWIISRNEDKIDAKSTNSEALKSTETSFGFLYLPYKKEFRYWELAVTLRLVLFSLSIQIVPYTHKSILFVILILVMQVSIWMIHAYHPYREQTENRMSLVSLYVILISYFMALISTNQPEDSFVIPLIFILNLTTLLLFSFLTFIAPYGLQPWSKLPLGGDYRQWLSLLSPKQTDQNDKYDAL
eukprot:TRINITY_DN10495_c0_g1_i2.p1 TRINITY_DN10495_c0_g1~~TRINITY_DN10495_c0_g1_i2.p1  ORF type:complete len:613 (-),score=82.61 TRINITY_DN10495_c0_g1_i2:87-1925(-)